LFTRSRRLLAAVLVLLAAGAVLGAGRVLVREDPLAPADAIYVLGGSWISRCIEAADLYHANLAPTIIVSGGTTADFTSLLARRGLNVPGDADLCRALVVDQMHVPAAAIHALDASVDNTAQEADAIAPLVRDRRWRRLIVITDRTTTRRAGYAMTRVLGKDVQVFMRAPRDDAFDPARWYASRASFRQVFYELPKLLAYWCGLRG